MRTLLPTSSPSRQRVSVQTPGCPQEDPWVLAVVHAQLMVALTLRVEARDA